MPDVDLDQNVGLDGGINTDISEDVPAPGHLTVSGLHGNKRGDLTKFSGAQLFSGNISGRVTGLFQVKLGTSILFFGMGGGSIYHLEGSSARPMLTGQEAAFYDGRVVGSSFFIASGLNPNRKILQDLAIQNVGIAAPETAPSAADNGAGVLTGTFSYRRVYKNSVTGHMSNPSPVSADITVSSKNILVTGLGSDAETDQQVDTQVLYRTTGTGAGVWFRVTELPISSTQFVDTVASLGEAVLEDNGVPPQAKYLEYYNGMLFYTGLASPNQSRVAVSGVLRPEGHDPDDVYDLDPEDEDIITGIKRFGSGVAVAKKKGLYVGGGFTPDSIELPKTDVEEGPIGNWTMVKYESNLAYLSERGPFVFSGLREQFIGYKIQELWRTLDLAAMEFASGVYYKPMNMLIWNAKTAGASDFDLWICFNTKTGEWNTVPFETSKLSIYLDDIKTSKLFLGDRNGFFYTGDIGTAFNGKAIRIELLTRGIGLKKKDNKWDLDQAYCFRHVELHYAPNGGSSVLSVQYALDKQDGPFLPLVNKDTGLSTFSLNSGRRARFDLNGIGRLLYVRITGESKEPVTLKGLRVEGYALGRR